METHLLASQALKSVEESSFLTLTSPVRILSDSGYWPESRHTGVTNPVRRLFTGVGSWKHCGER